MIYLQYKNSFFLQVWAVLKLGFLAFFEHPFDSEPFDIIIFDLLPSLEEKESYQTHLAYQMKEQNPLYYAFKVVSFVLDSSVRTCLNLGLVLIQKLIQVCCGNWFINLRTSSSGKSKSWVSAINGTALRPHRFGSFAPPRGLTKDGSQAQWFIDGEAAFKAIASAIKEAKSEVVLTCFSSNHQSSSIFATGLSFFIIFLRFS